MSDPYLQINNLKTHFPVEKGILFRKVTGTVKAVDGVSLSLAKGEVLGLVGESGCGKSTLGRTVLQLIKPTAGTVTLGGRTLTDMGGKELRAARADFQMIFQDPYASLNPRMTVYSALAEAIQVHRKVPKADLAGAVGALMEKVGLAARFMRKYPHEFSGGQRQRIAIARALAVEPKLIIADEPVSALDVSIQAQILNLLSDLTREMELTMIFISHDSVGGETYLRPHRRDVPRPHRRDRPGDGSVRAPAAPLHQGALQRGANARPRQRAHPQTHPFTRRSTVAAQPAQRLHLPPPLPARRGTLPDGLAKFRVAEKRRSRGRLRPPGRIEPVTQPFRQKPSPWPWKKSKSSLFPLTKNGSSFRKTNDLAHHSHDLEHRSHDLALCEALNLGVSIFSCHHS